MKKLNKVIISKFKIFLRLFKIKNDINNRIMRIDSFY